NGDNPQRGLELVRRAQVERIARGGDVAVAYVAEAAPVAGDVERADVSAVLGVGVATHSTGVEEDPGLIGGARVIEAVEEQVGPRERVSGGWQLDRLAGEPLNHGRAPPRRRWQPRSRSQAGRRGGCRGPSSGT